MFTSIKFTIGIILTMQLLITNTITHSADMTQFPAAAFIPSKCKLYKSPLKFAVVNTYKIRILNRPHIFRVINHKDIILKIKQDGNKYYHIRYFNHPAVSKMHKVKSTFSLNGVNFR